MEDRGKVLQNWGGRYKERGFRQNGKEGATKGGRKESHQTPSPKKI